MKKVSIIIPMYNSSKYIKQCIDSILNQTYQNTEIIVIDDKSADNCVELVESIKDDRIKLIKLQNNIGQSGARNKGIESATGDYICFIDADDCWKQNKLEKQVDMMEKNNYAFTYGKYIYLKNDKTHIANVPKFLTYDTALKNTAIFTSTVMFNMNILEKKDIYMPNLQRGEDTATWWKVLKKGITAYGMDEPLVYYRVGEKSLSSNKLKAIKGTWNLYKRENIGLCKKLYCFSCYAYNATMRRL